MKIKFTRRNILLGLLLVFLLLFGRPLVFLGWHYWQDAATVQPVKEGYANDASGMNQTEVDSIIRIAAEEGEAESQLQALVIQAQETGKKISIAGSRHSMGGHTIYPGGIVLDMGRFKKMQLDTVNNLLTTGSGATWADIIPYLDRYNRSVAVMQSNNSFSVGGSISVNCHGWQPNAGPIASTVESFRILLADGSIRNCSRRQNNELFSLALGGYGLFGVILDVTLKVVPNQAYRMYQYVIPAQDYIKTFNEQVSNGRNAGMVYGRLNISPDNFLNDAVLTVFRTDSEAAIPALEAPGFDGIRRTVFRASANSRYGKRLRWRMEKTAARFGRGKLFSRNQLINEPVTVFQNRKAGYTDILHEYFIPKDSVNSFLEKLKTIVPHYKVDLLNITIRNVLKDEDTYLRYAKDEVFGFVMLYNQPVTKEAEDEMRRYTMELAEVVMALGGTWYLPYRLHATKDQLYRAYPAAEDFFRLKKQYDPQEVFQNQFYNTYR